MSKAVDFSTPMAELLGGGGGLINPGLYRVVESDFRDYDFGKGPKNVSMVFYQKLQPVTADGDDEGEEIERRWPTNAVLRDKSVVLEAITPVKGRKGAFSQLRFTEANTHGKIYGNSAFGVFLKHCELAEVDMDAIGNDITAFEGNVYEYGLFTYPERKKSVVEEAEDGDGGGEKKKDYPKQEIVIVGVQKKKKGAAAKKKAADDDDEDDKPAKKKAKKGEDTPESLLEQFLTKEVCTDDNESGAGHLDYKLQVPKWLAKNTEADADMVKAVMKIYNDTDEALPALLDTMGWKYNKKSKEIEKA